MAKTKKYYAVFQGHNPGIYTSWDKVSEQVKGFKGAKYKSFSSREEAILWLRDCVIAASEPVSESLITLIKTVGVAEAKEDRIIIHTDGGASPNPGKGGYGIVLQKGNYRKELSAGYQLTTNNRMELMACIVALQALKEPSEVSLYTDSKYVVDSITKGWAKGWKSRGWKRTGGQLAENIDLWEELLSLLENHKVELKWVKGHSGNKENERCDVLANEARKAKKLLKDKGYHNRK